MLVAFHLLTMLVSVALLVFSAVFLFRTDRVPPELKALWAVVLFFGSVLATPVVFYRCVVRPRPTPAAS